MSAPDFTRQLDIVTPDDLTTPVTIIGVGGIGSPTALALVKMGVASLTVFDPDTVEAHNLPNQVFPVADVGRPKVTSVRDMIAAMTGTQVRARPELFAGQPVRGIVVVATDSMATRSDIRARSGRFNADVLLYIDARMGAQVCRVYSVMPTDPDDVRYYEGTLYTDVAAAEEPCTARATIYTGFAAAALIANQVRQHATGGQVSREIVLDMVTLTLLADGAGGAVRHA